MSRSTIRAQFEVLFAIILWDIHKKYSGYKLGNVWVVLEPILMIGVFILLFGLRGRGEFGFIEPPLFILAAFLPFKHFFKGTMSDCGKAAKHARQFQVFNQVGLFDVILAKALNVCLTGFVSGIFIGLLLFWLAGLNPVPKNLLPTIFYIVSLGFFGLGVGIFISVINDLAKELEKIIGLMTLPLLFLSAVFFPMSSVPEPYRSYLAYNPLVHPMELIREHWFDHYVSPVSDPLYWFYWSVGIFAFSMMVYTLRWKKVMAK